MNDLWEINDEPKTSATKPEMATDIALAEMLAIDL